MFIEYDSPAFPALANMEALGTCDTQVVLLTTAQMLPTATWTAFSFKDGVISYSTDFGMVKLFRTVSKPVQKGYMCLWENKMALDLCQHLTPLISRKFFLLSDLNLFQCC